MAITDFSTVGLYPVQGRARQDRELANLLLARGMNSQNTTTGLGAIGQGLSVVGALMGGRQANRSEDAANTAEREAEAIRMAQGGAAADQYMQDAADGGGRSIVDRIAAALGPAQEPAAPGPQVGDAPVQPTGPGAAPAAPAAQPAAMPGGTPPGFPGASATPSAAFASPSAPVPSRGGNGAGGPSAGYYARIATKESGGDPNARNASGAAGLYQFMPQTWAQYGGGVDVRDPGAQQAAMERFTADNARVLAGQGIPVNDDTLALAHQQGAGGAVKLLRDPNGRAVDTVGATAVRQNGGDENMTNAQFAQHVMGYYSGAGDGSSAFGGAGASGVAAGPNLPANMDPLERLYLSRMQNFTGNAGYGQELEGGYIGALDRAKYGADRSDEAWRRDFSERELAQRAAAEAARFNTPGRGEIWGVSPQYGINPDTGAPGMFIQSNMGNTKWLPMEATPQTQFLNTGTGFVPVDRRTGVAVPGAEGVAIDNAGKAAGTAIGEQTGAAVTGLPQRTESANQALMAGNDLLADPYFDNMFGNFAGSPLGVNLSQAANSAQARIDRFVNQTAPMAMESLKGLGPASDADRQGAMAAITNLRDNPRMRPEEARAEVQRFMQHVRHALEASQNAAQGNFAPVVTVPPPGPAVPPAPGPAQRSAPVTINGYTIERE